MFERTRSTTFASARSPWPEASLLPRLGAGEVQLWQIDLGVPGRDELLEAAYAVLAVDERARAAAMRSLAARHTLIAGRGCLRLLLAAALGTDARSVALETGRFGKPYATQPGAPAFNVAHSKNLIYIALSSFGDVGIDIEHLDSAIEVLEVAEDVFHIDELRRLTSASGERARLAEFYGIWTRKESAAKLDGRGLNLPLRSLNAASACIAESRIEIPSGAPAWVRSLPAVHDARGECYHAALALTRPSLPVDRFLWPGLEKSIQGMETGSSNPDGLPIGQVAASHRGMVASALRG